MILTVSEERHISCFNWKLGALNLYLTTDFLIRSWNDLHFCNENYTKIVLVLLGWPKCPVCYKKLVHWVQIWRQISDWNINEKDFATSKFSNFLNRTVSLISFFLTSCLFPLFHLISLYPVLLCLFRFSQLSLWRVRASHSQLQRVTRNKLISMSTLVLAFYRSLLVSFSLWRL